MATSHEFSARLEWARGGEGIAWGNHIAHLDGRPSLELSSAPAYRGDPARLNPEELLLVSVASCQMLTYLSLASRKGLTVLAYRDQPTATLSMVEGRMRISSVVLRPQIEIAAGGSRDDAERLIEPAHRSCFIANSVSCKIEIAPEITIRA